MSIKEDILKYFEPDGLIDTRYDPTPSSIGNSVYRDIYYCLLAKLDILDKADKQDWLISVNASRVKQGSTIIPGLFNRSSFKTEELQAHDDLIGLAATSYFADNSEVANEILIHGRATHLTWNNLEPFKWTARTFFARHPIFMGHLYFCSRKRPPLPWMVYWILGVLLSMTSPTTNSTTHYLIWLSLIVAEKESTVAKILAWIWRKILKLKTKNGMRDIMLNCMEENHPIVLNIID